MITAPVKGFFMSIISLNIMVLKFQCAKILPDLREIVHLGKENKS